MSGSNPAGLRNARGSHRILIVAPSPPPYGGMALQARQLETLLRNDGNRAGIFPSNLPFPKGLHFLDRLRYVRAFARCLLIWIKLPRGIRHTDIVHIFAASWWYFFLVVAPAVIWGRWFGKRVIINYRSGEGKAFFRSYGWLAKPVFRLASAVTAPSEFLAQPMRERFGLAVLVVPNFIDFTAFRFRERHVFQPQMLITRHLIKIYGVETVLRAFRAVQEHRADSSLWIAGTGDQEESLRHLAADWNLKNLRFLGNVAHEELPAIYDQCDILLNGSYVDNFPASLLEASASGLVVISTRAGGIPFLYENGKNAILVEPGDWKGLAAGVERVLADPSLGRSLAEEALRMCRQFDWENVRTLLYRSYKLAVPQAIESESRHIAGAERSLAGPR